MPAYELFSQTELLGAMALERMLAGLSTRRYRVGLEPLGAEVESRASATSRSALSRKFVRATESALAELLAAPLQELDLVALMVDGVYFAEHCCVVALGIGSDGRKHPLALEEGATENATLVRELLVGLRERGLDVSRPLLVVIDGSKALRRAVLDVFDQPVIQRCQLHKVRNVKDKLPERLRRTVERRMRQAYRADSALDAEAQLLALARELERIHPGAAASLREGLEETLTVIRLDVPPTLARTLRSTNPIESMLSICREHAKNVKRWRDGRMALRWCAAGMLEAAKQFRRVNGHLHLPALRAALERDAADRSNAGGCQETGSLSNGPPPKFYGERDILGVGMRREDLLAGRPDDDLLAVAVPPAHDQRDRLVALDRDARGQGGDARVDAHREPIDGRSRCRFIIVVRTAEAGARCERECKREHSEQRKPVPRHRSTLRSSRSPHGRGKHRSRGRIRHPAASAGRSQRRWTRGLPPPTLS